MPFFSSYFGVSRSSSVVIAYLMKSRHLEYGAAFEFVKSKRRFVQPNNGFIGQLKLWQFMGCHIDVDCVKYKLYRLRLAGEQMRKGNSFLLLFVSVLKYYIFIFSENTSEQF